jgi:MerR family copper efflux transcriptional regulator
MAPSGRRTISRAAREAGVGVETIRFYERRGILKQPPTPSQGYREYGAEAVWMIRYIKRAQDFGFTLKEVEKLQKLVPVGPPGFCQMLRKLARRKVAEIDRRIRALKEMRGRLNRFLPQCAARSLTGFCPILAELSGDPSLAAPPRRKIK